MFFNILFSLNENKTDFIFTDAIELLLKYIVTSIQRIRAISLHYRSRTTLLNSTQNIQLMFLPAINVNSISDILINNYFNNDKTLMKYKYIILI